MKKIFLFAVIALVGASFTSCKKDYTCKCTVTMNGATVGTTSGTFKATKSDAQKSCDALGATYNTFGATASVSCSL